HHPIIAVSQEEPIQSKELFRGRRRGKGGGSRGNARDAGDNMFSIGRWAEALADRVRHLALNPPLAPGGDGGGAVADAVAAGDDVAAAAPPTAALVVASRDDPLILRYLPLVVLLALFWPVVFALVAASVSASSWLFWLAVSAAFGTLQLLYVLYNFAMIFWDMGALTLLKTFAVLRSFSRYYLYKMTDATGLGGRRSKERGSRKRRRKEWREEADGARNYEEYCAIEIYEPEPRPREGSAKAKATRGVRRGSLARSKIRQLKRFASVASVPSVGSEDDGSSARSESWSGPSPPAKSGPRKRAVQCPSSPIRRNRSTNSFGSISIRDSRDSPPPRRPMRRSTSALRLSESTDAEEEEEEGVREAVRGDMGMSGGMLLTTLARLKEAREHEDWSSSMSSLKTLLSGIVKRNHLSVDDFLMQDARSVAERGQHDLRRETREAIDRYGQEVERCIDWVAGGPVRLGGGGRDEATPGGEDKPSASASDEDGPNGNTLEQFVQKQREELMKRIIFFKKMKQNLGHTALMLSGGGALTMYHLGTVKALVESDLYKHIHVISGTSGGSISAAMCAIKTPEELLRDICVNTVSTDYMHTGEMKRKNVSWFPELYKMGAFWLKNRLLMDSKEFYRCCEHYYSDITFEEAFEMTGKLVCITVSASRASAGSGVQRLLLNHISTPNVTLASAVTASCAVPGVMAPAKLLMKDGRGEKVPFEVDGVEWIDGSVQADLPFKRISTLFNVSNFVVVRSPCCAISQQTPPSQYQHTVSRRWFTIQNVRLWHYSLSCMT
ncbi:hypothetical protein ACHAWF_016456, partial [Thalassiosira exigua]